MHRYRLYRNTVPRSLIEISANCGWVCRAACRTRNLAMTSPTFILLLAVAVARIFGLQYRSTVPQLHPAPLTPSSLHLRLQRPCSNTPVQSELRSAGYMVAMASLSNVNEDPSATVKSTRKQSMYLSPLQTTSVDAIDSSSSS